jgi:hypothetical protein
LAVEQVPVTPAGRLLDQMERGGTAPFVLDVRRTPSGGPAISPAPTTSRPEISHLFGRTYPRKSLSSSIAAMASAARWLCRFSPVRAIALSRYLRAVCPAGRRPAIP